MAECKTAVTPLLMHWSYCSLALSHPNDLGVLLLYSSLWLWYFIIARIKVRGVAEFILVRGSPFVFYNLLSAWSFKLFSFFKYLVYVSFGFMVMTIRVFRFVHNEQSCSLCIFVGHVVSFIVTACKLGPVTAPMIGRLLPIWIRKFTKV